MSEKIAKDMDGRPIRPGDIVTHSRFGKGQIEGIDTKTYSIPMVSVKIGKDIIARTALEWRKMSEKTFENTFKLISKKDARMISENKGLPWNKGNRWVERILSVKQTCRIRALPMFPILVDAIGSYFKDQQPNLGWLNT